MFCLQKVHRGTQYHWNLNSSNHPLHRTSGRCHYDPEFGFGWHPAHWFGHFLGEPLNRLPHYLSLHPVSKERADPLWFQVHLSTSLPHPCSLHRPGSNNAPRGWDHRWLPETVRQVKGCRHLWLYCFPSYLRRDRHLMNHSKSWLWGFPDPHWSVPPVKPLNHWSRVGHHRARPLEVVGLWWWWILLFHRGIVCLLQPQIIHGHKF